MAASRGLDRDQHQDREWHAAVQLFGLSVPVPDPSTAVATAAAASEVSTKLADDVRSNDGIPCLPNKCLNVGASSPGSKNNKENWLQAISSQHGKMEADSNSEKAKNGLQAISSQHGKMEADSKSEEVKTDSDGSGKAKVFKKPDTILPCRRCNSMETKFCYFNNCSVNQPRHYCRNCRRYWTEGGTLRDVPVGCRHRNKQPSNRRHATKPHDANGDVSDTSHCLSPAIKPPVLPCPAKENEAITTSGSEVVFCKSLSPIHNTKGQKNNTDLVSLGSGDYKEEKSCLSLSSAVISGSSENSVPEKEANDISGYDNGMKEPPPHTQSNPTALALVFPYSSSSNSAAITASTQFSTDGTHGLANSAVSPLSLLPPAIPAPGIRAPAVPFPFPQVLPFWSCMPGWPHGAWSAPWPGGSGSTFLSLPPSSVACSGSDSLRLGKHPREANLQGEEKAEKTLWVPKTLRVTDPEEAAKSTIWASLGIKPYERIVFKSVQSKDKNSKTPESPKAMQGNPAASSCSLACACSQTFQERT